MCDSRIYLEICLLKILFDGDHFSGIGALLDRFPNARAVAPPGAVKLIRQQASPEIVGNETTTTARELSDKMLERYPDRANPGPGLWLSARAAKS
jgi:hypothetical protein